MNNNIICDLCDAAWMNAEVTLLRDDGRLFEGKAGEWFRNREGRRVFTLETGDGWKTVHADRVSAITIHDPWEGWPPENY